MGGGKGGAEIFFCLNPGISEKDNFLVSARLTSGGRGEGGCNSRNFIKFSCGMSAHFISNYSSEWGGNINWFGGKFFSQILPISPHFT